MSQGYHGNIEQCHGGLVSGWVDCSQGTQACYLWIDSDLQVPIQPSLFRQDVRDAGFGDGWSGFKIDLSEQYPHLHGEKTLSLRCDGQIVSEKVVTFTANINYIKHPNFALNHASNGFDEVNVSLSAPCTLYYERFTSPDIIQYCSSQYTRITGLDYSNHGHQIRLRFELEPLSPRDQVYFSLVAKSFNDSTLVVNFLNQDADIIYSEPVLIGQAWEEKKRVIPHEAFAQQAITFIELQWQYQGRHYIDFAAIALSLNADFTYSNRAIETTTVQSISSRARSDTNLISNGSLHSWSKGQAFDLLSSGQECADNWWIAQSNVSNEPLGVQIYGGISLPYGAQETKQQAMHVRTQRLNSPVYLYVDLVKAQLAVVHYRLTLVLFSQQRQYLPKVGIACRDGEQRFPLLDVLVNQPIEGLSQLEVELTPYQMEHIIQSSKGKSTISFAIELPEQSDLFILSLSLTEQSAAADDQSASLSSVNVADHRLCETHVFSQDTALIKNTVFFEDNSINAQLDLLDGIDNWKCSKQGKLPVNDSSNALLEFESAVAGLTSARAAMADDLNPSVDIIIPVYNATDSVWRCLSSLMVKTDSHYRLIIVNDGDDPATAKLLSLFAQHFTHVELLTNTRNLGYTKSVNRGLQHTSADWVVILNSDTVLTPGWLKKMLACALSQPNVGMVGALSNAASWQSVPCIYDAKGDWHLNPIPHGLSIDDVAEQVVQCSQTAYPSVGVINGFCQLIRQSMLDEIGLLDEVAFPIGYGEENDMCARAVKAGYRLLIADNVYIFHEKSKSFGHAQRKKLAEQGRLALDKKHPDINWQSVTAEIYHHPALQTLRQQLDALWSNQGSEIP